MVWSGARGWTLWQWRTIWDEKRKRDLGTHAVTNAPRRRRVESRLLRKLEFEQRLRRVYPLDRQAALAAVLVELGNPDDDVLLEASANLAEEELAVVVENLRDALDEDHLDVGHDELHSLPGYLGRRGVGHLADDEVGVCHCARRARER
jgi:hypothetical protein